MGITYITDKFKTGYQNIWDLFRANGMGTEIFWLTMSLERFKFLLQNIRLDDVTRSEKIKINKLAAVWEFFDELNKDIVDS